MKRILVWDIPARLIHWAFAVSLTAAIAVGFLVKHEEPLFQLHMLFGIVAVSLLVLRLVIGVVGSRYSRFASYPLDPREVQNSRHTPFDSRSFAISRARNFPENLSGCWE